MEQKPYLLKIFLSLILLATSNVCSLDEFVRHFDRGMQTENHPGQESHGRTGNKLSKPLIGNDGRVYTCSQRSFFSFESNGTIAWTIPLQYNCHADIAPVNDESGKIYFVAENRVLQIKSFNIRTLDPVLEIFFGPETAKGETGEIIGMAISIWSSSLFISIMYRGLFAYTLHGHLLWSAGPMLDRFGYRQGCKENITDCYFTSAPAIDFCEGSLYISNTEGQLYSLSLQSPHFNWIQDLSSVDKIYSITPGHNGRLYLVFPRRALLMALDVSTGNILWQQHVGPSSTRGCSPAVDSNGWASIGSLDGFLYSFSPTGYLRKFLSATELDLIQVSPLLDCSGAVYVSQGRVNSKTTHTLGENRYISATKPIKVVITQLVPATGAVYRTAEYPGQLSRLLFESDLHQFMLDERVLLAFVTSASRGLKCQSTWRKLEKSCSIAKPKHLSIYTGNERTILLFLLFQLAILIMLAGSVRFCYLFWGKRTLQDQDLGKFFEKRRYLHMRRKAFDKVISEMEQSASEEAVENKVLNDLGDIMKEKEGIERKLSTTYSLGRDGARSECSPHSRSLLPMYNGKLKSHSFQSSKKESLTIFHTLSDSSSDETSSRGANSSSSYDSGGSRTEDVYSYGDESSVIKAKAAVGVGSSSRAVRGNIRPWEGTPDSASTSKGYSNPLYVDKDQVDDISKELQLPEEEALRELTEQGSSKSVLQRRRTTCTKY
ncbi:protein GAMETE EXPRESSED 3 [Aristolochia californica]|uniref:protein GAMETE EXPRESSED 3 n=1 Tax=Aristolochia californica TaxID=171875 RepID=UPI0035D882BF